LQSTNSVAQEPEGSSPHSQQLAIGPYPEPVETNPHLFMGWYTWQLPDWQAFNVPVAVSQKDVNFVLAVVRT
jgi:hypothetical protein